MRVVRFEIVPYRLPLVEPVVWNGERCDEREGVLLRLKDDEGREGWGDAAPLPGFSQEALPEARLALDAIVPTLLDHPLDASAVLRPDGPFHAALDAAGLPSSARFALDLALADLAAQSLGRTLPQALHPDPAVLLPLNALLIGSGEAVVAQAKERVEEGYMALKLKVGRASVGEDVETAQAIRAAVGPKVELRLDANRAWSLEEATAFAAGVADVRVAYVEEPLRDPAGLAAFWLDTGLPVALDESVQEEGVEIRGWAEAVVLKPTLVGGLMATLRLAAQARAVGARPVLSAAFESGVGLRGVAALAAATGGEAAGLDTYRWLGANVLGPLPFDQPRVDVPALFAQPVEVLVP